VYFHFDHDLSREVRCGTVHLGHHTNIQKVSDFEASQIQDLGIRNATEYAVSYFVLPMLPMSMPIRTVIIYFLCQNSETKCPSLELEILIKFQKLSY
jgi:hypothetical protein